MRNLRYGLRNHATQALNVCLGQKGVRCADRPFPYVEQPGDELARRATLLPNGYAPALERKQRPLTPEAAGISCERAIRPRHAMTRHDERNGIPAHRRANRAGRSWRAATLFDALGKLAVRCRLAIRDELQCLPEPFVGTAYQDVQVEATRQPAASAPGQQAHPSRPSAFHLQNITRAMLARARKPATLEHPPHRLANPHRNTPAPQTTNP